MTGLQNDNCHLNEQIFLSSSGGNFGRSQCGKSGEVEYKLQDQQDGEQPHQAAVWGQLRHKEEEMLR